MSLEFILNDPALLLAIVFWIMIIRFHYFYNRGEKERLLEARIKRLEEQNENKKSRD